MQIIIRRIDGSNISEEPVDMDRLLAVEFWIDGKVYHVSEDLKRLVVRADAGAVSIEPLAANALRVRAT
jgi:hypothetical protein